MSVDDLLRNLLFSKFRMGKLNFDFLEGLLAVCITGVGFLLRTPFENGLPHWPYLLAEWYLAVAAAALIWRLTFSRKRALGAYSVLLILPTVIADGTILRGDACVGGLLIVCALLFLKEEKTWFFAVVLAVALLLDVRYIGMLLISMILWQNRRLKSEQLLVLMAAGAARFLYSYRAWFQAGYTLVTFHWPNIYEIVGRESVQGQLMDPVSVVGFFLSLGLMVLVVWMFGQGRFLFGSGQSEEDILGERFLRLCLFFVLAAGYFLPYMDQSYGYLVCVLSVLYFFLAPREFLIPLLLQIVAFAGYQECFHGTSMMPMALFSVIQFLIMAYLGIRSFQEAGVISICSRKN